MEINLTIKKWWFQSRTFVFNLFWAVIGLAGFMIDSFGTLLTTNLDYIKSIVPAPVFFAILAFIGIYNIKKRMELRKDIKFTKNPEKPLSETIDINHEQAVEASVSSSEEVKENVKSD